jgi:hypothetical protein
MRGGRQVQNFAGHLFFYESKIYSIFFCKLFFILSWVLYPDASPVLSTLYVQGTGCVVLQDCHAEVPPAKARRRSAV